MSPKTPISKSDSDSDLSEEQDSSPTTEHSSASNLEKSMHSFICTIDNFSKLPNKIGQFKSLSPMKIGNYEFKVLIFPGGEWETSKGYVSVFLKLCKPSKAEVNFTLSIGSETTNNLNKKTTTYAYDLDSSMPSSSWGWPQFIKRSVLLEVLKSTNDQLIVVVEILNLDMTESTNQLEKLQTFEKFINNEEFSDVQIIVGDKQIYANKIMLINGSEVFASMFDHKLIESKRGTIDIEDIEYDVMLELVRFIYIGEVHNLQAMAKKLLIAADKYCIEWLKEKCSKHLRQELSSDNVLELIGFADTYNVHDLKRDAMTFFKDNKEEITQKPQFEKSLEEIGMHLIAQLMKL